ncbi:MAG: VCBS repeat-containing protein [Myxococcales bacterium]|nr:VCBS repeat-containing protein [Myxococcales bacterium]
MTRRAPLVVLVLGLVTSARAQPPTTLPSLRAAEQWLAETLAASHAPERVGAVDVDARWPSASPDGAALERRLRAALPPSGGEGPSVMLDAAIGANALTLALRVGEPAPHWLRVMLARSQWLPRALVPSVQTPTQRQHFARVPLDAELRRYVAPLPALTETTLVARSYSLPARGYVALAVVELAGDGPAELVLLREDGVVEAHQLGADATGRVRLRRRGEARLPSAARPGVGAPRAFGVLTVDGATALASLRDREGTFRIARQGDALTVAPVADGLCPPGSQALADACAAPVDGRDYYASVLLARVGEASPARAPTSFYARARRAVRRVDGVEADVEAVVTPRGRIVVRTGDRVVGLGGYGAAIGLADVDHDGQAEVLTSSDALVGEGDQLRLLRVRADGALRAVWQSEPLEGSVLVAGAGDLDADGVEELLAIEEPRGEGRATLWVVR